ncbi:hypothetical protein N9K54_01305 [Candidatus Poseidonia alphae]|nr:hypothetical protein [Candidatus Poseidonia alphae]
MGQAWVVDSNCFIHLGQKAKDKVVEDLKIALNGAKLLITPGVRDEVATVSMRKIPGRPNLLVLFDTLLHSAPVDEEDVRKLAIKIGERAAPQDVDLSLMVLADQLGSDGAEVILVSDDFKMTTTAESAGLAFTTCPPSTFIERLIDGGIEEGRDERLRSLSRQVRASEMKYAISRRDQYDVQKKLTWMVDSLLASAHAMADETESDEIEIDESRLIADLTRTIRGYSIKPKRLEALGDLPTICQPVQRLDEHLSSLRTSVEDDIPTTLRATKALLTDVMEQVGLGLAPLDEAKAEIAHRAMAGSLLRTESALGVLEGMEGEMEQARSHLVRALHLATLVDDVGSERKAMRRLGVLALYEGNLQRSFDLLAAATNQPTSNPVDTIPSLVLSAIVAMLLEQQAEAQNRVQQASALLSTSPVEGAASLDRLGSILLAIDRPELAVELFDEAMELALIGNDETHLEAIAQRLLQAEKALLENDHLDASSLRSLLDGLTPIDQGKGKNEAMLQASSNDA